MMKLKIKDYGSPLTPEEIDVLEKEHGISIPEVYKQFLYKFNGGTPTPNIISYVWKYDIKQYASVRDFLNLIPESLNNIIEILEIYDGRIPENLFPIAMGEFDDVFCLSTSVEDKGTVYIWLHGQEAEVEEGSKPGYDNVFRVAASFQEFLDSLHGKNVT